jgi:hypothetical protein
MGLLKVDNVVPSSIPVNDLAESETLSNGN